MAWRKTVARRERDERRRMRSSFQAWRGSAKLRLRALWLGGFFLVMVFMLFAGGRYVAGAVLLGVLVLGVALFAAWVARIHREEE